MALYSSAMIENTYLDQLIGAARITDLTANRNGDVVASVRTLSSDGSKYRNQLFSMGVAGENFSYWPLTASDSGAQLLALSAAGEIYFSLDKEIDGAEFDCEKGVYSLPRRGEPQLAFTFPGGIDHLEVRGRASGELFIFSADAVDRDFESAAQLIDDRKKQGVSAVLHDEFPTRFWDKDKGIGEKALFVKELEKRIRRIELPAGVLTDFTVDRTGRRAMVNIKRELRGVHERNHIFLVDLFGKEETVLLCEGNERESFEVANFSPSDRRAFIYRHSHWLQDQTMKVELCIYDFDNKKLTTQLCDQDIWVNKAVWIDDNNFAAVADYQGASAIFRSVVNGESKQLTDDQNNYSSLNYSRGSLVALCDNHQQAPYPVRINDDTGAVSDFPDAPLDKFTAPGRLEKLTTVVEDGTSITSWLALPEHSDGPLPLVVCAHGGPWGSWNAWTYRWNPWVFTEAGFAVLLPDPGISTGYGQQMIERGGHSIGAEPYADIMAVIDDVVQREDIDGERTAFMGGSYGGYMTNWVAGQQGERFKCYVTHASIWNQEHMYFTTDNGGWHEWMWEAEGNVRNTYSPHQFAQNIQAPMLVIHGDKDYRVPISQAHMLWFDLKRYSSHLDHKFLYFPDEGHWILKPGNSKIWYQTVLAFLKKHMMGEEFEAPRLLGNPHPQGRYQKPEEQVATSMLPIIQPVPEFLPEHQSGKDE